MADIGPDTPAPRWWCVQRPGEPRVFWNQVDAERMHAGRRIYPLLVARDILDVALIHPRVKVREVTELPKLLPVGTSRNLKVPYFMEGRL